MADTIAETIFFSQKLKIKKRYTNREIKLLNYFHEKTKKIYPVNVIVVNNFIFFFVNNEDYFKAKVYQASIRRELNKKVMIINSANILINLLFSFFPDTYIHNVKLHKDNDAEIKEISVLFLSFEERGIAIGTSGDYIKAINYIFDKYVIFAECFQPVKISCELIDL